MTIPGFPTASATEKIRSYLEDARFVSIIESTIPVTHGYSNHANDTLRRAHTTAVQEADDALVFRRLKKPNLCVLYRSTVEDLGFAGVCARAKGIFDGVILEWPEPDASSFAAIANEYGIELVQCIGPWMDKRLVARILSLPCECGLVYLMSADKTGAELFDNKILEACVQTAKAIRPDIVLAAGFGVRTAADVARLAKVRDLGAVIIGTEFLLRCEQGLDAARTYLERIASALSFPAGSI